MGYCHQYQNLVSRYLIDVLREKEEGNKYGCICFENSGQFNTVAKFKKAIWANLGPKIQSLDLSVNLKATDTDVCRYTIIISKV